MSSDARRELSARLGEATLLTNLDPVRRGDTQEKELTNAVNRGALVLACSHLEGYLEDLAVEVLDVLVLAGASVDQLPLLLRALHAEVHLKALEPMRDRNVRAPRIESLFASESALWQEGRKLESEMVRASTVVEEMANPGSKEIDQFLELLGVPGFFDQLDSMGLRHLKDYTNELVGKRNAVAHGELAATATAADVDRYIAAVADVAAQVDWLVALAGQDMCELPSAPWAV